MKLSPRKQEILRLIALGKTNYSIAFELGICESTVKTYIYEIYTQIKVPNRAAAVSWYHIHIVQKNPN